MSKPQYDSWLILSVFFLLIAGTIILYSTSAIFADHGLVLKRGIHMVMGLGLAIWAMNWDYHRWEKKVPLILFLIFISLLLVCIPGIGHEVNGGRRWLRLFGMSLQPSEFLKLGMILYAASYLNRKQGVLSTFIRGLAPSFIMMGIFLSLVLLQPDFGTTVLIFLTILLMLYVGGARPLHVFGSLTVFGGLACVLVLSNAYRVRRLLAFMDPWKDPLDTGFQIIQSFIAVGSGGLYGKGLGESRQKLNFLPDAHTDFIFAIWGEELGFIGVCFLLIMFVLFLWRGMKIAVHAKEAFGRYLAFGITCLIGIQILLNLFVVTGLIPTKGLPLPFISSGGSSMLVTLLMTGILLNIHQQSQAGQATGGRPLQKGRV